MGDVVEHPNEIIVQASFKLPMNAFCMGYPGIVASQLSLGNHKHA